MREFTVKGVEDVAHGGVAFGAKCGETLETRDGVIAAADAFVLVGVEGERGVKPEVDAVLGVVHRLESFEFVDGIDGVDVW